MIITLWGPDSYRRIKKLGEIVDAYRGKHSGLSHDRFDGADPDSFASFMDFAGSVSMFDPVKLAILDNVMEAEDKKSIKEVLKKYIDAKDLTVVVNTTKKPPATLKFLLEKPAQSQEFPALKGEKIKSFIRQTGEEKKVKLDADTINALADAFGSDTWGIVTEIERMALTKKGEMQSAKSLDYFALMNGLKRGRTISDRLTALELLLSERGDDPARVFNSVAYRLGSEREALKFANYDVAVKSGKLEYEEVLLDLALGN